MKRCSQCGKRHVTSEKNGFFGILAGQLSFEITMILFGAYGIVCYNALESFYVFIASLVVGGIAIYAFNSLITRKCEPCSNLNNLKK